MRWTAIILVLALGACTSVSHTELYTVLREYPENAP